MLKFRTKFLYEKVGLRKNQTAKFVELLQVSTLKLNLSKLVNLNKKFKKITFSKLTKTFAFFHKQEDL